MQYDRSLVTDLTYPFEYSETGMLIRSPDQYVDNTLLIVTEPFKWEVNSVFQNLARLVKNMS
jgi:hypothetical protein